MIARLTVAILFGCALALTCPDVANAGAAQLNVRPAPLDEALREVARQTGVDLLFDRDLVRGRRTPGVRGAFTPEAAIRALLAGTDVTVRRAASGALLLEAADAAPLAQQDVTVSELLIVGRRTQNADIRRSETDIQPYRVDSGRQIVNAHRDDLDQYFRTRITANTQVLPANQRGDGETISEIDLRGLGPEDTLILVDGRRMPSVPGILVGFRQADLNAFPLHAIDRIETLTGSAGGIYGFGALGGVVNVVIDRERRGFELHGTGGISSRGDARRVAFEGGFGYASDDGRTELTLFAGYARADPLRAGQRDYLLRDRRLAIANAKETYLRALPLANSIGLFTSGGDGPPLVFKAEYGGGALGSDHTYLPLDFAGDNAALVASLKQRAGQLDLSLSDAEAGSDMESSPTTGALLVNLRRQFGWGIEAYADAVILSNRGRRSTSGLPGVLVMPVGSALNPFTTDLWLTVPTGQAPREETFLIETSRYTAGLLADLPLDWRGTAEISFGSVRAHRSAESRSLFLDGWTLFGDPATAVDPFRDWSRFQAATAAYGSVQSGEGRFENRYAEQSLRLAGPVFETAAGVSTLTLLAARREEDVPPHVEFSEGIFPDFRFESRSVIAGRSMTTASLYAELRARLFGEDAPLAILTQSEIQIAVRRDDQTIDFSRNPADPDSARMSVDFVGTTYTLGAKASPLPWLILRGSYATGEQPPSAPYLVDHEGWQISGVLEDPHRPGVTFGGDGYFWARNSGSPALKTIRAETLALGAVVTPGGPDGPRVSLDYSRIRRTRDVLLPSQAMILAHPDLWPERITRGPLTEADRARGFTAGPLTMLDSRAMNAAGLEVEAIDARAQWPLPWLGGQLRLHVDATYYMRKTEKALFQPDLERSGFRDGPLTWRANGGAEWSNGPLTLGANLQYYGAYHIYYPGQDAETEDAISRVQGGRNVPGQAYLDIHASRRFVVGDEGRDREFTVAFAVINLLDAAPPRESDYSFTPGYSRYGDPRQRRFELTVSSRF